MLAYQEITRERVDELKTTLRELQPVIPSPQGTDFKDLFGAFIKSPWLASYGFKYDPRVSRALVCLNGFGALDFLNYLIRDESRIPCGTASIAEPKTTLRVSFSTKVPERFYLLDISPDKPDVVAKTTSWEAICSRISTFEYRPERVISLAADVHRTYWLAIPSKTLDFDFTIGTGTDAARRAFMRINVISPRDPVPAIRVDPHQFSLVLCDGGSQQDLDRIRQEAEAAAYAFAVKHHVDGLTTDWAPYTWLAENFTAMSLGIGFQEIHNVKAYLSQYSYHVCGIENDERKKIYVGRIINDLVPLMTYDKMQSDRYGELWWASMLGWCRANAMNKALLSMKKLRHAYRGMSSASDEGYEITLRIVYSVFALYRETVDKYLRSLNPDAFPGLVFFTDRPWRTTDWGALDILTIWGMRFRDETDVELPTIGDRDVDHFRELTYRLMEMTWGPSEVDDVPDFLSGVLEDIL